jgi:hypothetical protein
MTRMSRAPLSIAAFLLAAAPAMAQGPAGFNYDVKTMNFDLWCQETAHLPVERCDKRTAADEADFEAYRASIERYEIPYLQQKRDEARIDRDILHNDPVDNPIKNNPAQQRQDPNQPPLKSPP